MLKLALIVALLAAPAGASENAQEAEASIGPIGLEELIHRVQQRDPELAALRREIFSVEAAGQRALRPRDPEVRLGYSSTSHSAVPDPFTEVREETMTSAETRSRQSTLTGTEREGNDRTDLSQQDRESGTVNSTTTRTTIRETTPGRRSASIQEAVYESTREQTRESATRSDGSSDRATSTRGSETSQVVEQRIEEQTYGRDTYEGSDDYSVELRLYPSHPLEQRARRGRARADTRIAEYAAETRAREIAHSVRAVFVDLQLLDREGQLQQQRIDELNREVAFQQEMLEAGRVAMDRYADSRVDAIDARLNRDAIRAKTDGLRDKLAARAGLADPARIELSGGIAVTRVRPADLDQDRLIDAAWLQRRELGLLEAEDHRLAQDLALNRAARTPWLSLLSGRYTYQERYGEKYRDEYSVVAGVTVPIFRWFGDDDGALLRKSRESLARDTQVLRERIELDVSHALRRLGRARADLSAYADEHLAFRKQLQTTMEALPDDVPAAREQRSRLGQTLVSLQTRELGLTRAYAEAVLALEEVLGASIDEVLHPSPALPALGAADAE